jgi:hypothetical protein
MGDITQEVKSESKIDPKVVVLEALKATVVEKYGADNVSVFQNTINFRRTTSKQPKIVDGEVVIGEDGKPVLEDVTSKRDSFDLVLFRPRLNKLIELIKDGGKVAEYLLSILEDDIYAAAYAIVAADPELTTANFPLDKIDLTYLAEQPREPKSRGLDKELVEAFIADFKAVMPEISGREQARIDNQADILVQKFSRHRSATQVLELMQSQLALYISQAPKAQEFSDVLDYYTKKVEELLTASKALTIELL